LLTTFYFCAIIKVVNKSTTSMDLKAHILAKIQKQKQIKASEIIKEAGFSRTYVNRALKELRDEGRIVLLGKTNVSLYVLANIEAMTHAKKSITSFRLAFDNKELAEDVVLDKIKKETGIFLGLPDNVDNIVSYAFLEMLNNAIEHSSASKILVLMEKKDGRVSFVVADNGVGIFNNIKQKFNLPDIASAVQELYKGKQTTALVGHSGMGIYFTSKIGEVLSIKSFGKKLIFNNALGDISLNDARIFNGTWVFFSCPVDTAVTVAEIFGKFTDKENFEFNKTEIPVRLFKYGKNLLSRSEARRIIFGLEKFKEISLNFSGVDTVGQSFADEIFRVWQSQFPDKKIVYINANENVLAMIKMAINS